MFDFAISQCFNLLAENVSMCCIKMVPIRKQCVNLLDDNV